MSNSNDVRRATGNSIARLADPDSVGRTALEGGALEVVVNVPVGAFSAAYKSMHPIMGDGAPHLESWLLEEGRSEDELRLLCGLFCTVADNLPMDTAHHLKWLERSGFDQHLDEFAQRRVARMLRKDECSGASLLSEIVDSQPLRALAKATSERLRVVEDLEAAA